MPLRFYPSNLDSTDGVLTFFSKRKRLQKYISVFSSPTKSNYFPENVLNINTEDFWACVMSSNEKFVGFNFSKHSFKPYFYKIRQYKGDGHMLKNWVFQGSNDRGATWEDIDAQANESFCSVGIQPTLQISLKNVKEFTSFQIVQTGKPCSNNDAYMRIAGIEMFGELKGEIAHVPCTHKSFRRNEISFLIFLMIATVSR